MSGCWDPLMRSDPWEFGLAFDWGVSRPSVCLLLAWSPGACGPDGVFYARGSLAVVDEWTSARLDEGRFNDAVSLTISQQAAEVKQLAARWGIEPAGVADPALWSATGSDLGSVADQFENESVFWQPAPRIGRIAGWARVRELLLGAGAIDRPGLYICVSRCPYLWTTLVHAPRDLRKPEDLDTTYADHALDALRYGVLAEPGAGACSSQPFPL